MKAKTFWSLMMILALTVSASYAQEITVTTTKANTVSSKVFIELPGLANNPEAIIVATPVGDTQILNPHAIGAWYNNNTWSIFNCDHAMMPLGLTFKVQVFLKPGANQFLHLTTKENLDNEGSFIDNPALNNNPNAQVKISQNHAPNNRAGSSLNRFETIAEYNPSSGKWYIKNVNGAILRPNTGFNIVIISGGAIGISPNSSPTKVPTPTPNIPTATESIDTSQMIPEPLPIVENAASKTIKLTFDHLNDFVEKGLPPSAALPFGNIDHVAAVMAQQISNAGENSLPVLLTALQTAGFTIIDENGKVLLKPANGKGQGLGFYDFEAVGALKLNNRGVTIPLEKIAGVITTNTPEVSAAQFAELIIQNLRTQANNSDNAYLRFYARLIIELGKSSGKPVDLMTAPANQVNLSMLQVTLLMRRLQGDIYTLKTKLQKIGTFQQPFYEPNSFIPVFWAKDNLTVSHFPVWSKTNDSPCNLTGDEALILDGAAVELTFWNGWQIGKLGESTRLKQLGMGVQGANAALAWLKLVASLTMMKGVIDVSKPLPLIRTLNSNIEDPRNKRLMVAKVWSEVGKKEMLNCVRPLVNAATGLDFNLPTDGPLADVVIEWNFSGENQTRVIDADTRNTEKFVLFKAYEGNDPNPQKQVTNVAGISMMWLVGAAKTPALVNEKNLIKIEKKAEVEVAVSFKSAKDVKQNSIDFLGMVIGVGSAGVAGDPWGLLGLIGSAAEIGYRAPYVAARATIPVEDHEACDGLWQGTITYTDILTEKVRIERTTNAGKGYSTTDNTKTYSGTITVNSSYGQDSPASSSADEISISNDYFSGQVYCSPLRGTKQYSSRITKTSFGSGTAQGTTQVAIYQAGTYYEISIVPVKVFAPRQTVETQYSNLNCQGPPGNDTFRSTQLRWEFGGNGVSSKKMDYGADKSILSGTSTRTKDWGPTTKQVQIITWNLRRCH